jgi:hypothetical protein
VKLDDVFALFAQARDLGGHRDFVIVGSLSILGLADESLVPADMAMSNDIDGFTRADPGRIFDLDPPLGADSPFHAAHGYFLDPVSPSLPTLPDGWEGRLNKVERDGLRLWFLDPNDAAVSKYARGEPRDQRWIRSGLLHDWCRSRSSRHGCGRPCFLTTTKSGGSRRPSSWTERG